jgi:hypothetical protein
MCFGNSEKFVGSRDQLWEPTANHVSIFSASLQPKSDDKKLFLVLKMIPCTCHRNRDRQKVKEKSLSQIEGVSRWHGRMHTGQISSVDEREVQIAIIIIIQPRRSRTEGLKEILLAAATIFVLERNAGLGGDISEAQLRLCWRDNRAESQEAEQAED